MMPRPHFQESSTKVSPSEEGTERMAQLLVAAGELDAAEVVWERLATADQAPHHRIQALDSLLDNGKYEAGFSESRRKRCANTPMTGRPFIEKEWRTRVSTRRWPPKKRKAVVPRHRSSLRIDDDVASSAAKALGQNTDRRSSGSHGTAGWGSVWVSRRSRAGSSKIALWYIRARSGLRSPVSIRTGGQSNWAPRRLRSNRIASLAYLLALAQDRGDGRRSASTRCAPGRRECDGDRPTCRWDWYYLNLTRGEGHLAFEAARDLARLLPKEPARPWAFLNSLASRGSRQPERKFIQSAANQSSERLPPLKVAEVDSVLASLEVLRKQRPDWVGSPIFFLSVADDSGGPTERSKKKRCMYRVVIEGGRDARRNHECVESRRGAGRHP